MSQYFASPVLAPQFTPLQTGFTLVQTSSLLVPKTTVSRSLGAFFSELVARAREELHCHRDDGIAVEGVLHLGSPSSILRKMISIGCADQWENYVRSAMKCQF